ncbi:hypothetical protein F5Y19DRAFT_272937 [Xylariaceae sp. FL1651]|nr:hypothetical protein F5Y19DRAFT_272937 [Xylariaceae sp. FL1651]
MDARPYRPNCHLPNPGIENDVPPTKNLHQRHKSTGNLLTMSATGNLSTAAKRTALADRNVASRGVGDALYDSKSVNAQNCNVASSAQENRVQAIPKNTFKNAFFQPAQRRPKSVIPSASMTRLRSLTGDILDSRNNLNRASMSTFVYNDKHPEKENHVEKPASRSGSSGQDTYFCACEFPQSTQHEETNSVHAAPARSAPEDWLVVGDPKERPSTNIGSTQSGIKQELTGDVTSAERSAWLLEQCQLYDHQPSHHSSNKEVNPTHSSIQPALLRVDTALSPSSPRLDDDITEAPYVDAVEGLAQEEIKNLTDVPAPLITAPPEAKPTALEHSNPTKSSTTQPEANAVDSQSNRAQDSADDHHYLSEYDEEDYYDEQGYTTAHSYRSRSDNTTGGVTTIMFPPKLTKKGLAEIEAAKQIVNSRRTTEEIQEDIWDVSMVAEYGDDIFRFMKDQEMNLLPNPHYMDIQTEIQWSMRSVLMDWVVQVHTRFGLLPETLFLTVNYIDRFLSYKVVSLGKLQLVGATAIFIAAKYEEINCPSVQEIVYMVDGGYTGEEILKAERFMLSMLDFELGWPGPMSFLRRISKADDYDLEARTLAKYFLEVVIMDERFVASPPSYIAAGAHCFSRLILHKGDWTPSHVHYSGYTYNQLKPLVAMLLDCCRHARKHHSAVFEKYSDKRYRRASTYVEEEIMRGYTLPFQQRISMPLSVDFFVDEATRASYTGTHALKMPIPIQG